MNHIPSPAPQTSDSLEREIQAKANKAPRVTPADIEAEIASEFYFTAADGVRGELLSSLPELGVNFGGDNPLSLLTFSVLVLRNGFTITGESACASPENFNAEIGKRIARENAVAKIWPLLGYELRSKLSRGDINTFADEQLKWHGELTHALLDALEISSPEQILPKVEALVGGKTCCPAP